MHKPTRTLLILSCLVALSACGDAELRTYTPKTTSDMAPTQDMRGAEDMAPPVDMAPTIDMAPPVDMAPARDMASPVDMAPTRDMAPPEDMSTHPPARSCVWKANSFDQMLELDVTAPSVQQLTFTIPGLPDPSLLGGPVHLSFASYDADHPGQEGVIQVNGQGRWQLPANAAWDNQPGTGRVQVTGVKTGTNTITFGPGSTVRTFYRIGQVQLEADAHVTSCQQNTSPPTGPRVTRELGYRQAVYEQRHNWVVRCNDYAFTAYNREEHASTDCDGLFNPDGSRRGKAHFDFPAVVAGTYEIQIHARHTANRNPNGALFIVNGEEKRLSQVDPAGPKKTTVWGTRALSGDVRVTLDSTREGQSDSVIWVKLVPR